VCEAAPEIAPDSEPSDLAKTLRCWTRAIRWGVVVGFGAAAVAGWTIFAWPKSLDVALSVMTLFIAIETVVFDLWAKGGGSSMPVEGSGAGNAYADAAKVAITTQGIVLGLVAFQEGRLPNVTVAAGACALAAGVLAAGVLYLNVALGAPTGAGQKFTAAILFSLVYWCLGFGLICVVAGSWV
jgi:hypothetical protein